MAIIKYKNLVDVFEPEPTKDGGKLLNDNFKAIADSLDNLNLIGNILNKETADTYYAPLSHTHTITNITDLQDELDKKVLKKAIASSPNITIEAYEDPGAETATGSATSGGNLNMYGGRYNANDFGELQGDQAFIQIQGCNGSDQGNIIISPGFSNSESGNVQIKFANIVTKFQVVEGLDEYFYVNSKGAWATAYYADNDVWGQTDSYPLNRYISAPGAVRGSGQASSADLIVYSPFYIKGPGLNKIGLEITAAVAGNMKLGIYNCVLGLPTSLIWSSSNIDTSVLGFTEITTSSIPQVAGWYVIAAHTSSNPSWRAANTVAWTCAFGNYQTTNQSMACKQTVTFVSGLPSVATPDQNTSAPAAFILMRKV